MSKAIIAKSKRLYNFYFQLRSPVLDMIEPAHNAQPFLRLDLTDTEAFLDPADTVSHVQTADASSAELLAPILQPRMMNRQIEESRKPWFARSRTSSG